MNPTRTTLGRGIIIAVLLGTVALFVAWSSGQLPTVKAYHTEAEIAEFRGGGLGLAGGANNYFTASGDCYGCHGPDVQFNYASVTEDGTDVNVMDDWRSTMMGNSARDPFWRAKVSHEVTVNPDHQDELEDKCTSCHAPMGRFDKFYMGLGHYSMEELAMDPIAQDGVSCLPCHMQGADSLGLLFSGNLKFDTNNVLYGPYDEVFGAPMTSFVGYEPLFGAHINDAGLCAGCHTLITETADLEGNLTGDQFVEQATYHEWLNSVFNTDTQPETGISCQGCHMPRIDDAVVISANYLFLQGRSPYGLHHMAGANTFMLELLKNNSAALGLTASSVQFDSTIARTNRMLQNNSLMLDTWVPQRNEDTAYIDVKVTNLAGHKFPSGYPARRAFVELAVLNADGDTMFTSGRWNSAYEVEGHDDEWEPHHDVIFNSGQAQIYEMVMGDVNGNKTTVLERAKLPLKDNRLVPLGFTTTHPSYDTTLVAGVGAGDLDFNKDEIGIEGNASDIVHYHVGMNGYTGLLHISTRVWYQSAPPRWMEEMFAFNTADIDTFRDMYDAAEPAPVLVREMEIVDQSVAIEDLRELGVRIFPNPVRDGLLRIEGLNDLITGVEVYDLQGAVVAKYVPHGQRNWQVRLPRAASAYVVVVRTGKRSFVEQVVAF